LSACRQTTCRNSQLGICAVVDPLAGGGAQQTFRVTVQDPKGAQHIAYTKVLINGSLEGARACYIYYKRARKIFLLVDDAGLDSTALAPGASKSVSNGQCRLDGVGSSIEAAGNELKLRMNLTFLPGFYGEKQIFLASDTIDGKTTQLESSGSWTVP
jgi:hypothetical protein